MARRTQPPPQAPRLSPEKAIRRLEQRIAELEGLDCSSISDYDAPELRTLRSAILTTLEDSFGQDSRDYHRFSDAAAFRQSSTINLAGGFGRGARGPDNRQVQADCLRAKQANTALLRVAVQVLAERMEDQVSSSPTPEVDNEARTRTAVMHFHNVHTITGNVGVGNTSGSISSSGSIEELSSLIVELRKYERELAEVPGLSDLPDRLNDMDHELRKTSPNRFLVAEILTDVRNALSGATGNLLATGAMTLIKNVIGG